MSFPSSVENMMETIFCSVVRVSSSFGSKTSNRVAPPCIATDFVPSMEKMEGKTISVVESICGSMVKTNLYCGFGLPVVLENSDYFIFLDPVFSIPIRKLDDNLFPIPHHILHPQHIHHNLHYPTIL